MSGGDFLARWSRRKRAVAVVDPGAAPLLAPPDGAETASADSISAPDALSAEEIARLPPLDSLTSESDLAQFLRAGVPKLLRNAALRRMWSLDPGIRDYVSEAREYAYDWNVVGGVPGQGPMLPTDDIAAMIRDIFGGTPPPEPVIPETVQDTTQAADAASVETSPEAVALPAEEAPRDLVEAREPLPAGRPEPGSRPPVRRHGGAVPI